MWEALAWRLRIFNHEDTQSNTKERNFLLLCATLATLWFFILPVVIYIFIGEQVALPGEKATFPMLQRRCGFRPEFVQCVRFFFGHSCHRVLLQIDEGAPCFAALHRMEYTNSMLINDIVQNLQQPTAGIKAKKQAFVIAVINLFLKNEVSDGVANINFADTVLEGSLIKLNIIVKHSFSISRNELICKVGSLRQ